MVQSIFRGEREQADDLRLLRRYAADGCAQSFETVVRRHIGWVYSSSLRQLNGDAHLAEDVTQAVFVLLARRAATLHDDTLLTGWLFNTLRFTAKEARRKEARRRKHESAAALIPETPAPQGIDQESWEAMAPLLDQAVASLKESDRQAVLLRFYEGRDFAEIARILGLAEPAARKRVSRAVERLGRFFHKRGITRPAALILALLLLTRSSEAAHLVPTVLATAAASPAPLPALASTLLRRGTTQTRRATPRQLLATMAAGIALLALLTSVVAWIADAPPAIDLRDLASPASIDTWASPAGQAPLTHTIELPANAVRDRAVVEAPPTAAQPREDHPAHPLAGVDAFWWVRQWFNPANPSATSQARRNPQADHGDNSIDPATGQPRPVPGTKPQDYVESYAQMGGGGGSAPAATPRPLGPVAGEINGATATRSGPAAADTAGAATATATASASARIAAVVETIVAATTDSTATYTPAAPAMSGQLTPITLADVSLDLRYIDRASLAGGTWYVLHGAGTSITVLRRYVGGDGSAEIVIDGPTPSDTALYTSTILFVGSSGTTPSRVVFGPVAQIPRDTGYIAYVQTPEPATALLLTALALPLLARRRRH